jgi:hypothetical protein
MPCYFVGSKRIFMRVSKTYTNSPFKSRENPFLKAQSAGDNFSAECSLIRSQFNLILSFVILRIDFTFFTFNTFLLMWIAAMVWKILWSIKA